MWQVECWQWILLRRIKVCLLQLKRSHLLLSNANLAILSFNLDVITFSPLNLYSEIFFLTQVNFTSFRTLFFYIFCLSVNSLIIHLEMVCLSLVILLSTSSPVSICADCEVSCKSPLTLLPWLFLTWTIALAPNWLPYVRSLTPPSLIFSSQLCF